MLRADKQGTVSVLLPHPATVPPRCLSPRKCLTHPGLERDVQKPELSSTGHLYELLEMFLAGSAAQTMRQRRWAACWDAGERQPSVFLGEGDKERGPDVFNSQHKNKPDELADR